MKKQISPSVMRADFMNLKEEIRAFEENGIEYLHVDIMDGRFVPNFTLGTDFCRILKRETSIPLDLHLMVEDPEDKLAWFDVGEGDYVSVHYESTRHIQRVLQQIKAKGARTMLALNPGTPLSVIEEVFPELDAILVMTVNPGFAGQKLVPSTLDKIRRLRKYLDENGYGHVEIECDGNVSFENAKRMCQVGADIFVAGSSSVFSKSAPLPENIAKLRKIIEEA